MAPEELAKALAGIGRASIPYSDPSNPDRPLVLECYRPATHAPHKPLVIVQHGQSRNGREYCDAWIPVADLAGFLVVAITFLKSAWPDALQYNNGHVLAEDGTVRPREAWSLAIPGRVFGLVRASGLTTRPKTFLWGHSAGGQFVHRLLATQPHDIFEAVGAANSGWYTLPTLDRKYPEGLGGIGQMQDDIARLLAYPLVIFSGDRDIDTGSENLPRHDAAMSQGPHRLARSQSFLDYGQAAAARLGLPCNWRRVVVPGVAHEGMRMSDFAARYWFSPSA